ncbi:MAG: hypothetical protein MUP16_04280 [Sedimentisphaerales bacterium]|nr:hypothetical protein [Sedimentisphaerales bacterium]
MKSEAPNPKSQTSTNEQNSNIKTAYARGFEHWNIRIWNLFGTWDFDIGILKLKQEPNP